MHKLTSSPKQPTHKLFMAALLLFATAFISVSCDDSSTGPDNNNGNNQLQTVTDSLYAPGVGQRGDPGDFVFYSLREQKTVTGSESTAWDIAFSGRVVIVNSGVSGPGNGGAVIFESSFDEVNKTPTQYHVDTDTSYAIPSNLTNLENTWYKYDMSTHTIGPKNDYTIVVKTADGNQYYKLQILAWYKQDEPGHFKFKYKELQ